MKTDTSNTELQAWVQQWADVMQPEHVVWADGSAAEDARMRQLLVDKGSAVWLNPRLRPNSLLIRSDPRDVARVESKTLICCRRESDAGPTNQWGEPVATRKRLMDLYRGCMQGRTLYVIPFSMGPVGSPIAQIGVELTDSPYVVVNMRIMTRMGDAVLNALGDGPFVQCVHSVGYPLTSAKQNDVPWPCDPDHTWITHFPETREVLSYGSGYGGNALLGKKCFALRLASAMGREEGWMAEHMLILGIEDCGGRKTYVSAAFPSACGKTNFAMLIPPPELGYKVFTVGDDIAWIKPGADGEPRAINPEAGWFGVAPGTSMETNPMAMASCSCDAIFTNCALTETGDVWWEGMTEEPPACAIDWLGREWDPDCGRPAAHPNARFTAPAINCPTIDPDWEKPEGVRLEAMIFGGRRMNDMPLVYESRDWAHGTYVGATMGSEMTAAAEGTVGQLRRDPMAMRPFIGYHAGDYLAHWFAMGAVFGPRAPRIFHVNWFRKSPEGKWLWPGFGENGRVLKWIIDRVHGEAKGAESPLGIVPGYADLFWDGLEFSEAAFAEVMAQDPRQIQALIESNEDMLDMLGDHCPPELREAHQTSLAAFEGRPMATGG